MAALGSNPGRQVARIVIYLCADLPPPFSSGRGGPRWRVAHVVSCLASIKGPGNSSIFSVDLFVLKIKLRERERERVVTATATVTVTVMVNLFNAKSHGPPLDISAFATTFRSPFFPIRAQQVVY
jgi:hypothetical protein